MATLNALIAVLAILGMTAVAVGYRASLREPFTATWYFVSSIMLIAMSVTLRLAYWDLIWVIMKGQYPETARLWSGSFGRPEMNFLFNVVFLLGVYFGLKARQLLIPVEEQASWPWWKAWAHPQFLFLGTKQK